MGEKFLFSKQELDQVELDGYLLHFHKKILVGNGCHIEWAEVEGWVSAYATKGS